MSDEYVDIWPTEEYPDARPSRDYEEQYKPAFDRWIAGNAAAAAERERARRAAAPQSSPTPDVAPDGHGPHLPTWPPTGHSSSPPQAQPGSPQGLATRNEHHAEYLRQHQADIYSVAPSQNPYPGGSPGFEAISPRNAQAGGFPGFATCPPRNPQPGSYQGFSNAPPPNFPPGAYDYDSRPPPSFNIFPPGIGPPRPTPRPPTPANRSQATTTTRTPSTPAASSQRAGSTPVRPGRAKKLNVTLSPGFVWDRESLALLCHWKDRMKKGTANIVQSGEFPGHTARSLDDVWAARRQEARRWYQEMMDEME